MAYASRRSSRAFRANSRWPVFDCGISWQSDVAHRRPKTLVHPPERAIVNFLRCKRRQQFAETQTASGWTTRRGFACRRTAGGDEDLCSSRIHLTTPFPRIRSSFIPLPKCVRKACPEHASDWPKQLEFETPQVVRTSVQTSSLRRTKTSLGRASLKCRNVRRDMAQGVLSASVDNIDIRSLELLKSNDLLRDRSRNICLPFLSAVAEFDSDLRGNVPEHLR